MKAIPYFLPYFLGLLLVLSACGREKRQRKGFAVNPSALTEQARSVDGLRTDSLTLRTKAQDILLTQHPAHRLTPIYRINYHSRTNKPFTGSNRYYRNYETYGIDGLNNWNGNYLPGFSAMTGYNLVNIAHHDQDTDQSRPLFGQPVLIRTLYYPAYSRDTLNGQPIARNHYLVSAHDEDTNGDGFITTRDLRRFFLFNLAGERIDTLLPPHYSAYRSEYDPTNDRMLVFARLDENQDGQTVYEEATHIRWIDLKDPRRSGWQYRGEAANWTPAPVD